PSQGTAERITAGGIAGASGDASRHGSQDRPEVPEAGPVAQRSTPAAYLADAARPAGGGGAAPRRTAAGGAGAAGQDAPGVAAAGTAGASLGTEPADAGAARPPVEGAARLGQGSILCPGA